ncbi:MAG: hypothetical protein RBS73_13760 [Prolixibacteraceae bacterium]|jgi:hypothetical protein|nr:hypothetical protein [Prolixibacteraceae bacterium]
MKKSLLVTAASLLLFMSGCEDEPTPELTLGLETKDIQVSYKGDTVTIPVSANVNTKVAVTYEDPGKAGWIFLLPRVLYGNGNIEARIQPSSDIWNGRKAWIKITGEELTDSILVEQSRVTDFHPEDGVEINGLLWAKCDVGEPGKFTSSPDVRGLLYQYDSRIGYPNSSPNVDENVPAGYKTGWFELGPTWTPENSPCPPGWRIPTADEIKALIGDNNNKKFAWVTPEQSGFAVPGVIVGIPAAEAALATKNNMRGGIFWPQSGFRDNFGKQTVWWPANITSITRPSQNWDRVTFWIDEGNTMGWNDYTPNAAALPVRCVADLNQEE